MVTTYKMENYFTKGNNIFFLSKILLHLWFTIISALDGTHILIYQISFKKPSSKIVGE
jgi:hypothetical protein